MGNDVDIAELAKQTKNFSGAEIEGLVRAATATAMNQLIKVLGQIVRIGIYLQNFWKMLRKCFLCNMLIVTYI